MTRRISFVVVPGFEPLDLSGPMSAFHSACAIAKARYEINVVSCMGGLVPGWFNLCAETSGPDGAAHGDTIIVVGGPEANQPQRQPETSQFLKELAPSCRRIASVCTGVFYLAEAGLLTGHRVTTHWRWAPLLQSHYPDLSVEPDRIYINDGNIWTSAGVSSGIDLALALIDADFGNAVSQSVARELVVYHRRPGGQSQFSAILDMAPESDRVRKAIAFAREHLHEPLPVERLAEAAHISNRQFTRVFLKETGETPARAVERMRAEVARPKIEEGCEGLEVIARDVGFGDIERMRRCFIRVFGQTPQNLRRRAQSFAKRRSPIPPKLDKHTLPEAFLTDLPTSG